MGIVYNSDLTQLDWLRISELFFLVGWGQRPPEDIEAAFRKSSFVRFAYSDGVLVGFGRTVDDGKYYASIVDLIVHPEFQGKGIGSSILAYLKDALEGYLFTTLTTAVGKGSFYEQQGWKKQTTGYIWPRSAQQEKNNT